MKHYGDICQLKGVALEPVDCVTGGSPCQDLSIAGNRAGLEGERSGLLLEQTRLIRELREEDAKRGRTGQSIRPRFAVWENVPGAFSSGKPAGEDFRIVLESFARIADPNTHVPRPSNGKWQPAGIILGDGWSIAWRVLDAQYWGVPQRRARIALVADFGGQSAPEILFEREGVPGDTSPGGEARQAAAGGSGAGPDCADRMDGAGGAAWPDTAGTLIARQDSMPCVDRGAQIVVTPYDTTQITSKENASNPAPGAPCHTLNAQAHEPLITVIPINTQIAMRHIALGEGTGLGVGEDGDPAFTLQANHSHAVATAGFNGHRAAGAEIEYAEERAPSMVASMPPNVVAGFKAGQGAGSGSIGYQDETAPTLGAEGSSLNNVPAIVCRTANTGANGDNVTEDIAFTLDGAAAQAVMCAATGQANAEILNNLPPTLSCNHEQPICFDARGNGDGRIAPALTGDHGDRVTDYTAIAVDCRHDRMEEISGTLQAKSNGGQSLNYINPVMQHSVVRRLTPLECERLQGFPDGWTDIHGTKNPPPEELGFWRTIWDAFCGMLGIKRKTDAQIKKWLRKPVSDTAFYKALGNSIALPPWAWVCERISAQYDRPATLGSLFDGIGGFPLVWERANGKGTALWASEIEPFCVAVTKERFGVECTGINTERSQRAGRSSTEAGAARRWWRHN